MLGARHGEKGRVSVASRPRLMRELVLATISENRDIDVIGEIRGTRNCACGRALATQFHDHRTGQIGLLMPDKEDLARCLLKIFENSPSAYRANYVSDRSVTNSKTEPLSRVILDGEWNLLTVANRIRAELQGDPRKKPK